MCLGILKPTRIRTTQGLSSAYQVLVWSLAMGPLTPSLTPTGGCAGQEGHRAASRTLGSDAEHGITQNDAAEALAFSLHGNPVRMQGSVSGRLVLPQGTHVTLGLSVPA